MFQTLQKCCSVGGTYITTVYYLNTVGISIAVVWCHYVSSIAAVYHCVSDVTALSAVCHWMFQTWQLCITVCFKHATVHLCVFQTSQLCVTMCLRHHNWVSLCVSDITAGCHHVFKTSQLCVTMCFRHHNCVWLCVSDITTVCHCMFQTSQLCVTVCFRHHNSMPPCVLDVTIVYHCVFY